VEADAVEVVKIFVKQKHFVERSWKRTRKPMTFEELKLEAIKL